MTYNLVMGMWFGMSCIITPMLMWIMESELRDSKWYYIVSVLIILNWIVLSIVYLNNI
jgi:uncharacterized membrane protein YhdT